MGLERSANYGIMSAGNSNNNSSKPPTTSFSAQVQFLVSEGLNGGPNWKLINFQGPAGGGGGGSAGGGGGGSGSGSGSGGGSGANSSSGGGGGQQLLNFNRTATDLLLVTFTPTCAPHLGTNWDLQSTCPDSAAVDSARIAIQDLESRKSTNDVQIEQEKQRLRSHRRPRNELDESLFPLQSSRLTALQNTAVDTQRRIEAAQSELSRIQSSSTTGKANAAAYGATQNLLYRLSLPGLGQLSP
jgi:hypothetical protein